LFIHKNLLYSGEFMVTPSNHANQGKPLKARETNGTYPREEHKTKMAINDTALGIINGPNSKASRQTAKFANQASRQLPEKSTGKADLVSTRQLRDLRRHLPAKPHPGKG
jgi:hypothetical protein